jgi:hypothetical protein
MLEILSTQCQISSKQYLFIIFIILPTSQIFCQEVREYSGFCIKIERDMIFFIDKASINHEIISKRKENDIYDRLLTNGIPLYIGDGIDFLSCCSYQNSFVGRQDFFDKKVADSLYQYYEVISKIYREKIESMSTNCSLKEKHHVLKISIYEIRVIACYCYYLWQNTMSIKCLYITDFMNFQPANKEDISLIDRYILTKNKRKF